MLLTCYRNLTLPLHSQVGYTRVSGHSILVQRVPLHLYTSSQTLRKRKERFIGYQYNIHAYFQLDVFLLSEYPQLTLCIPSLIERAWVNIFLFFCS